LRWGGLGLSLILAAALSGFIAMRYAIQGTVVIMPNLVGRPLGEAVDALNKVGLSLRVLARKSEPGKSANVILNQDPVSGMPVKANQTVRVIVSSADKKEAIPEVIGASLRVAQMTLMNSGYVVGDICRIHHGQENSLEIIDQGPSSNESRAEDVPIQLLLNLGAPEEGYLMPDFVGRDVNEAIQLFEKNRIRIETVSYRQNTGFVKGLVLAQLPERGHYLSRGTEVRFEVSR
jgi:hypothetical protein